MTYVILIRTSHQVCSLARCQALHELLFDIFVVTKFVLFFNIFLVLLNLVIKKNIFQSVVAKRR